MLLRALEPSDLPALHAQAMDHVTCEALDLADDTRPEQLANLIQVRAEPRIAIGAFQGSELLGASGMSALDRPRQRHIGRAWLACRDPEPARALLDALIETASDWWKLDRLELTLAFPTNSDRGIDVSPFQFELLREWDVAVDDICRGTRLFAWVRPGVKFEAVPREFPRAPKGPLPADFAIRPNRVSDAAAYAELLGEPSVLWGTLQSPFTNAATWTAIIGSNDPRRNATFVATVGGEIIANCGLHGDPGPRRAHVWRLGMSVKTSWQGRGVGQALMEHLVAEAARRDVRRLELEVYADNTRAIALYEKFGFVREGVRRCGVYRAGAYVDSVVMARIARFP